MPPKLDRSILATCDRLEGLLRSTTQTYAPNRPLVDLRDGKHNFILVLCLGKGKDFYNIGRWMLMCIDSGCKSGDFITPKLETAKLRVLERIWVQYHRTGRKYGQASPPPYLLESPAPIQPTPSSQTPTAVSNHLPHVPSLPPQPPRNKRTRTNDNAQEPPTKYARSDSATSLVPSMSANTSSRVRRPIIDLTRRSGHRLVIDLTSLDSESESGPPTPDSMSTQLISSTGKLARRSKDRQRMAHMRHLGTIDLD